MKTLINITTDETFETDVLQSGLPVLIDFWAPWCAPCKMIAPILEDIATIYEKRLCIFKINVDEHKNTAIKYNIRSIPHLIIFKNGQPTDNQIGSVNKSQLIQFIDKNI